MPDFPFPDVPFIDAHVVLSDSRRFAMPPLGVGFGWDGKEGDLERPMGAAEYAEDTRGLSIETLSWQPSPGMNTIGMLLAHIAIVEVFWIQTGLLGMKAPFDVPSVLGIGIDDDGIPIPERGGHPATLAGKELAFYDDLLARARGYVKQHVAALTDADLDSKRSRVASSSSSPKA